MLKITVFLTTLVSLVYLSKWTLGELSQGDAILHVVNSTNEKSIVFMGSSRIMQGVNENLLNELNPERRYHNLAISGGTFLSSCILADLVLENSKCRAVVIELSPITPGLPPIAYELLDHYEPEFLNGTSGVPGIFSFYDPTFYLSFQNSRIYENVSLLSTLRKVRDNISHTSHPVFGYLEYSQNNYKKSDSFLAVDDMISNSHLRNSVSHKFLIEHLGKKAKEKNVDVLYLLPVTYNNKEELKIIVPVFNSISESNKIVFDSIFFEDIVKSEYLLDRNHFNAKGAEVYTMQILRLLKEKGY